MTALTVNDFGFKVSDWVNKSKDRVKAVRNESFQRLADIMQTPVSEGGNMPVRTGFLRSSLEASLNGAIPPSVDHPGTGTYDWNPGKVNLVIASAELKDTINLTYTSRTASYVEYGTSRFEGRRFVGLAMQQWQTIVNQVCQEAKK